MTQDPAARVAALEAELAETRSRAEAAVAEFDELRRQLENMQIAASGTGCRGVPPTKAAEQHGPTFAAQLRLRDPLRRHFVRLARELFGGDIRAEMTLLEILGWTHAHIRELERTLDQMQVEREQLSARIASLQKTPSEGK